MTHRRKQLAALGLGALDSYVRHAWPPPMLEPVGLHADKRRTFCVSGFLACVHTAGGPMPRIQLGIVPFTLTDPGWPLDEMLECAPENLDAYLDA